MYPPHQHRRWTSKPRCFRADHTHVPIHKPCDHNPPALKGHGTLSIWKSPDSVCFRVWPRTTSGVQNGARVHGGKGWRTATTQTDMKKKGATNASSKRETASLETRSSQVVSANQYHRNAPEQLARKQQIYQLTLCLRVQQRAPPQKLVERTVSPEPLSSSQEPAKPGDGHTGSDRLRCCTPAEGDMPTHHIVPPFMRHCVCHAGR